MLFLYNATVVFALNIHLILLMETLTIPEGLTSIGVCQVGLQKANTDMGNRLQELLQIRLLKDLPISATPLIAPPLILQAMNVAAARDTSTESAERRKLDVFTRTLNAQQQKFDGSDFCIDVLNNIIAYAQADEKFLSSMMSWRDNKGKDSAKAGARGSKLDWCNLLRKHPRLFLRLFLHLDYALCTWSLPQEKDFPAPLRRS